jgi:soluble cytochrome b562
MSETTKKAASKVKDFTEPAKEFSGLVKENYLNGLDFSFSLFEQNFKALAAQADQFLSLEKEFLANVGEFYKEFPKDLPFAKEFQYEGGFKKIAEQLDSYHSYRKEQLNAVKTTTEKLTKDARAAARENVEKAFSLFGEYFNAFGA